jgi:hypothetical protein
MAGLLPAVIERPSKKHKRIATPRGRKADPAKRQTDQQAKTDRRARNKQARKTRKKNRR